MLMSVQDGGLLFRVSLGSGVFETDVKAMQSGARFDDNQWHKLVMSRESREVSAS